MKNCRFNLFLLYVSFFIGAINTYAQQINNPVHKDTIWLNSNSNGGQIQWQQSQDSLIWSDIIGASDSVYGHIVNTLDLPIYFRSVVTQENCDPYFSQTLRVTSDMPTYYWSDSSAWDEGFIPIAG